LQDLFFISFYLSLELLFPFKRGAKVINFLSLASFIFISFTPLFLELFPFYRAANVSIHYSFPNFLSLFFLFFPSPADYE